MLSLATKNEFRRALDAGETVVGGPGIAQLVAASLNEDQIVMFQLGDGRYIEGTSPVLQLVHANEIYVSIRNAGDERRYVIHYDAIKQNGAVLEVL